MVLPKTRNASLITHPGHAATLLVVFLVIMLAWTQLHRMRHEGDDTAASSLLAIQLHAKVSPVIGENGALNCRSFLEQWKDPSKSKAELPKDPNDSQVFAAYMTQYDPPFWISQHSNDRKVTTKGFNEADRIQTERLERILQQQRGNRNSLIVLEGWNDWGWIPLFAASKGASVRIHHSQNQTNEQRLCESILLNHWDQPGPDARIQIFEGNKTNDNEKDLDRVGAVLVWKLLGDRIEAVMKQQRFQDWLAEGKTQYLWLEYNPRSEGLKNHLGTLLHELHHARHYDTWSPDSSKWPTDTASPDYASFLDCREPLCSLWWKRKDITSK